MQDLHSQSTCCAWSPLEAYWKWLKFDKGLTSRGQSSWHPSLLKCCICLIAMQVCHYIVSYLLTTIMPDVHYSAAGMKHDNELEVQGREQIVAPCSPVTIFGEKWASKIHFVGNYMRSADLLVNFVIIGKKPFKFYKLISVESESCLRNGIGDKD